MRRLSRHRHDDRDSELHPDTVGAISNAFDDAELRRASLKTTELRVGALRRFLALLRPEERRLASPQWIARNMPLLQARLAQSNPKISSQSLATYVQRALGLIQAYLLHEAETRDAMDEVSKKLDRKVRSDGDFSMTLSQAALNSSRSFVLRGSSSNPHAPRQICRLRDGREIEYTVPAGGLTLADVFRFAFQLMAHAVDFEPTEFEVETLVRRIRNTAVHGGS